MELDHIFVFVDDGRDAERFAIEAGLVPTHRRRHTGQGTENVCFRFGSAYLELLWVCDEAEITSEPVLRTGLWPRSQWRTTGACPFGVGLRGAVSFPTWTYDVPFPPGVTVEMSNDSAVVDRPLLFAFGGVGSHHPDVQPLGSAITSVELGYAGAVPGRTPELTALGVAERARSKPRVTVTIDGGVRGLTIDIEPALMRLSL